MADIFVSYAREDLEKVRLIVRLIEAAGWSAFWDRTIPAGMTWRQHIGRALDEAKCIIVVWSKYSVESKFVQEEADDGNERGILIPVLVEKARPPLGFRSIQHEDMSDWKGDPEHPGAKSLLKSIERIAGKSEKHPSVPPVKPKSEAPLQKKEPESKPEGPIPELHPDTNFKAASDHETAYPPPQKSAISSENSTSQKHKTGFFLKAGSIAVALILAAVVLLPIIFRSCDPKPNGRECEELRHLLQEKGDSRAVLIEEMRRLESALARGEEDARHAIEETGSRLKALENEAREVEEQIHRRCR